MGKGNTQRVKGNLKPASSQRAADILSSNIGFNKPGFIGFQNANLSESMQNPLLSSASYDIDPNIDIAFKRIAKKDLTTKLKALQDIINESKNMNGTQIHSILKLWSHFYPFLAFNENTSLKELSARVTKELLEKLGQDIVYDESLSKIISYMYISSFDLNSPKLKYFDMVFPNHTCQINALLTIQQNLTQIIIKNLKNFMKMKKDNIDEVVFLSANLLAIKDLILRSKDNGCDDNVPQFNTSNFKLIFQSIIEQDTHIFKECIPHNKNIIYSSFFDMVQTSLMILGNESLCKNMDNNNESWNCYVIKKIFVILPKLVSIGNTSEKLIKSVWEGVTIYLLKYNNIGQHTDINTTVIPAIFDFLGTGDEVNFNEIANVETSQKEILSKEIRLAMESQLQIYSKHIYPSLLPIIHLISQLKEINHNEVNCMNNVIMTFFNKFFTYFYNGSVKMNRKLETSSSKAFINSLLTITFKTYFECLLYTFDHMLSSHTIEMAEGIREKWVYAFLDHHQSLILSSVYTYGGPLLANLSNFMRSSHVKSHPDQTTSLGSIVPDPTKTPSGFYASTYIHCTYWLQDLFRACANHDRDIATVGDGPSSHPKAAARAALVESFLADKPPLTTIAGDSAEDPCLARASSLVSDVLRSTFGTLVLPNGRQPVTTADAPDTDDYVASLELLDYLCHYGAKHFKGCRSRPSNFRLFSEALRELRPLPKGVEATVEEDFKAVLDCLLAPTKSDILKEKEGVLVRYYDELARILMTFEDVRYSINVLPLLMDTDSRLYLTYLTNIFIDPQTNADDYLKCLGANAIEIAYALQYTLDTLVSFLRSFKVLKDPHTELSSLDSTFEELITCFDSLKMCVPKLVVASRSHNCDDVCKVIYTRVPEVIITCYQNDFTIPTSYSNPTQRVAYALKALSLVRNLVRVLYTHARELDNFETSHCRGPFDGMLIVVREVEFSPTYHESIFWSYQNVAEGFETVQRGLVYGLKEFCADFVSDWSCLILKGTVDVRKVEEDGAMLHLPLGMDQMAPYITERAFNVTIRTPNYVPLMTSLMEALVKSMTSRSNSSKKSGSALFFPQNLELDSYSKLVDRMKWNSLLALHAPLTRCSDPNQSTDITRDWTPSKIGFSTDFLPFQTASYILRFLKLYRSDRLSPSSPYALGTQKTKRIIVALLCKLNAMANYLIRGDLNSKELNQSASETIPAYILDGILSHVTYPLNRACKGLGNNLETVLQYRNLFGQIFALPSQAFVISSGRQPPTDDIIDELVSQLLNLDPLRPEFPAIAGLGSDPVSLTHGSELRRLMEPLSLMTIVDDVTVKSSTSRLSSVEAIEIFGSMATYLANEGRSTSPAECREILGQIVGVLRHDTLAEYLSPPSSTNGDTERDAVKLAFVTQVFRLLAMPIHSLSLSSHFDPQFGIDGKDLEFILCTLVVYASDMAQVLRGILDVNHGNNDSGAARASVLHKVLCYEWLNLLREITLLITTTSNNPSSRHVREELEEFFSVSLFVPLYEIFSRAIGETMCAIWYHPGDLSVTFHDALTLVSLCMVMNLVTPLYVVLRVEGGTAGERPLVIRHTVAKLLGCLPKYPNTVAVNACFLTLIRILKVFASDLTYSTYDLNTVEETGREMQTGQSSPDDQPTLSLNKDTIEDIIEAGRNATLNIMNTTMDDINASEIIGDRLVTFCHTTILTLVCALVSPLPIRSDILNTPLANDVKQKSLLTNEPEDTSTIPLVDKMLETVLTELLGWERIEWIGNSKRLQAVIKEWWTSYGLNFCGGLYKEHDVIEDLTEPIDENIRIRGFDPIASCATFDLTNLVDFHDTVECKFGDKRLTQHQLISCKCMCLVIAYLALRQYPTRVRRLWVLHKTKAEVTVLNKIVYKTFGLCQAIVDAEFRDISNYFCDIRRKNGKGPLIKEGILGNSSDRHLPSQAQFDVKVKRKFRELSARYSAEDFCIEIDIKLPEDYPLNPCAITCTKKSGVSNTQWRTWLLQLNALIVYRDGSLLEGLKLWKRNVDRYLDGASSCMICFSIIDPKDYSLTKNTCPQCKNKYHSTCLYKWFKTSHNTSCPLCRNRF